MIGLSMFGALGCNLLTPLAFVPEAGHRVPAEFDKLPGKRVAVLVWTDPSTLFDYPHARFELASFVSSELDGKLNENKLNVDMVDARDVEDYVQKNPQAQIDPRVIGKAFDADYVIYLEILRFQMRDLEHPQFLRGYIEASITVHDIKTQYEDQRKYELTPVTCRYPESAPVAMTATNAPQIREGTYRMFAEMVAGRFYDHTVYDQR